VAKTPGAGGTSAFVVLKLNLIARCPGKPSVLESLREIDCPECPTQTVPAWGSVRQRTANEEVDVGGPSLQQDKTFP
jgi:hypothetical protein